MKDRIKQIMESQHMTQQVFAQFIEMSPASLSSVFNGRTQPTLNIVEKIKKKIPDISTDWLMFGTEPMYVSSSPSPSADDEAPSAAGDLFGSATEGVINFSTPASPPAAAPQVGGQAALSSNGVKTTRAEIVKEEVKHFDKPQRRVIEIRVFYDDQTWETFVPAKK